MLCIFLPLRCPGCWLQTQPCQSERLHFGMTPTLNWCSNNIPGWETYVRARGRQGKQMVFYATWLKDWEGVGSLGLPVCLPASWNITWNFLSILGVLIIFGILSSLESALWPIVSIETDEKLCWRVIHLCLLECF